MCESSPARAMVFRAVAAPGHDGGTGMVPRCARILGVGVATATLLAGCTSGGAADLGTLRPLSEQDR
ncbi:MAG: hypothetical protein QOF57_2419, partial [Frankiaceae bacterium]|nr:hypothetical protein [Frankiaceae bacterium]